MLENAPIMPTLVTTDMERAKRFYGEKLGLEPLDVSAPATTMFQAGAGTMMVLYEREGGINADHTVAGWMVGDVEKTVEALSARGVVFEQYDMPGLKTDERGIAELGGVKTAWFKDSEGNILAISGQPE
jgi:predicted enzyme related to lactoylglutathione lyase